MTGRDVAQYIANLLFLARADGGITEKEESCLEQIRMQIGSVKRDLDEAQALVADDGYEPAPAGRFSDQVRNVEDMVILSRADGEMGPAERNVILSFAKAIELKEGQIDRILAEGETDVEAVADSKKESAPAEAKKEPPQTEDWEPHFGLPEEGVSIEFAELPSGNLRDAIRLAQTAPQFEELKTADRMWYLATWPRDHMLEVVSLVQWLRDAEERCVYADGKRLPWDDVFAFLPCMQQRDSSYLPAEHCFGVDDHVVNIWGCKNAGMEWSEYAQWFTLGKFKDKDVFVFDKKRIQEEVGRRLHDYRFCPYLRLRLVSALLKLLPDEVKVSRGSGWKYRGYDHETPGSIKVTIREDVGGGGGATRTIYARGVGPIGNEGARELLKEAFHKCGIHDVDYRTVAP